MTGDAVAERQSSRLLLRATYAILALLALAICVWRVRYFHEPLENDLAIRMAYAARAAAGGRYYVDMLVFGPAGSLWVNELFYRLTGASELSIYLMGCTFAVLTLLGVFRCAFLLTDLHGAMIAALAFTLINADLFTQANQPNAEVFIDAFLVCAFALVLDPRAAHSSWLLVAAGLLFFLASSIKHFVVITPVLAAAGAVLLPASLRQARTAKDDAPALGAWSVVIGTLVAAWAALLVWYAATNRLSAVLEALTGSSVAYATQQQGFVESLITGLHPFALMPPHQLPFVLLYAFLAAALIGGLAHKRDPRWAIVLGWALGTWVSVSLSGRFYAHYYMLWLPLISVGTGAAFSLAASIPKPRLALAARAAIVLVVVAVGVRQVAQLIRYDAQGAVLAKYGYQGAVFAETRALGERLADPLFATASIFEVGAHGLYFYTGHLAPVPFVDSLYGIDSAYPQLYRDRMLPGLLQAPPDLLVVRRAILRSGSDRGQREFVAQLLNRVPYVEDTSLSGENLMVLRRQQSRAAAPGG